MERIKLSRNEKTVLRLLASGEESCPDNFPSHAFTVCVRSLERKGLVRGAYESGGDAVAARVNKDGMLYIAENPSLLNPIDWKWIITTTIALIGMIAAIVALFVACALSEN